jgi:hypothetical protein
MEPQHKDQQSNDSDKSSTAQSTEAERKGGKEAASQHAERDWNGTAKESGD